MASTALATVAGSATPAGAHSRHAVIGVPKPIPGGVEGPPSIGIIHSWLTGPEGAFTPILEIPSDGPNADPSLITDFSGTTAFAVVTGEASGSDGKEYLIEADVRVMDGRYLDENGTPFEAAFAFL